MTLRLYSCRESPDGKHHSKYYVPWICFYCGRSLVKLGWPRPWRIGAAKNL